MNQLTKAYLYALIFHDGQVDKAGIDYILHPMRVSSKMETAFVRASKSANTSSTEAFCSSETTEYSGTPESVTTICLAFLPLTGDRRREKA